VSLVAVDIHGCETTVYKQVLVDELPVPAFEYSGNLCDSTLYFTDLSSGSGAAIESWLWDYGDGSPPELIENPPGNTAHFYQYEGTYTVTLTVINTNGCVNSTSMEVDRDPCLNSSFAVIDDPICERNTIYFADSSTVDFLIEQWHWYFGDGSDTTYHIKTDSVGHYYETAGKYNVSLVVSAEFNGVILSDTLTQIITVRPTPQPAFVCAPVCLGDPSKFIDSTEHTGSYLSSWHWTFGTGLAGDTSDLRNPVFKYDSAGIYNVELITINQYGCLDSVRQEADVNHIPIADFEFSIACKNDPIYFTDLSDGFDTEISSWEWNFNDSLLSGDQSTLQNPVWTYAQQGVHIVSLVVENENGCADTAISNVQVNTIPNAGFTLTDNYENMQGSVLLEDNSNDAIEYLWDFGDGYESWDNYPPVSHVYEEDGEYVITQIVWNEYGCPDSSSMEYTFMFKTLYIPNALSPSSTDPEVRVFQPKGRNLRQYSIAIYDSWGNMLWESNKLDADGSPVESWDGTYNGTPMPIDVYIWVASAVFKDGTFWEGSVVGNNEGGSGSTSGTVTIIR
jgi:PKD repeat protein